MRTYQTKHKKLVDDPNVARWFNNNKRGSIITAEVGLQRLGRACDLFKTTPAELAKMTPKDAANFLMDLATKLGELGLQKSTKTHHIKLVRSWFKHNDIVVNQRIKLDDAETSSKVAQEESPTNDIIRRLLNACDHKQKAESALMAFAGVRPESMGNYRGTDGLRIRDFPELKIYDEIKKVEFEALPAKIIVRKNLSKSKKQYFTFLHSEGAQYIKEFLEHRMIKGEKLTPDSPVIASLHFHRKNMARGEVGFITTRKIGQSIKKAIEAAGFDYRPYVLRTFFATRLLLAESEGLIPRDMKVFLMGHVGSIEAVYSVGKGKLPQDLVDKMRSCYEEAAKKHLTTISSGIDENKMIAGFNRQFLLMSGVPEETVNELNDLSRYNHDDLKKIIQENTKQELGLKNGNTQKVVSMEEVEALINTGWQWVGTLPSGKAVVRLPES